MRALAGYCPQKLSSSASYCQEAQIFTKFTTLQCEARHRLRLHPACLHELRAGLWSEARGDYGLRSYGWPAHGEELSLKSKLPTRGLVGAIHGATQ